MNYIRTEFLPDTLPQYVGYHVQIFQAGRAKISMQGEGITKTEFYASLPTHDKKAYQRQKKRSLTATPKHFQVTDAILAEVEGARIFRLHEKGNNNKTADNAHLIASHESAAMWIVMSGMVHKWELTYLLAGTLILGGGKRVGVASIFNEYMPTFDHDWEDTEFEMSDYQHGCRLDKMCQRDEPKPNTERSHSPFPAPRKKIENYGTEDPSADPILFTNYDEPDPYVIPEDERFERVHWN
jgi:hypothetical protein